MTPELSWGVSSGEKRQRGLEGRFWLTLGPSSRGAMRNLRAAMEGAAELE